ncbi:MAG: pilus assembly protein PilP [Nitrospinota bacterium]|nr:pilus assembly protein PilP [Nitrospinota bacterium]
MKGKFLLGMLVLAAAFLGYQYMLGQNTEEDVANVKSSFKKLAKAISASDVKTINMLVSPTFTDATLKKRKKLIEVLSLPRKTYIASLSNVQLQGSDMALVFYTRTEIRGKRGKMLKDKINGEIWNRDPSNPKLWKLSKLAQKDKWFRKTEIPIDTNVAVETKQPSENEPVLGSLEKKEAEAKAKAEAEKFEALEAKNAKEGETEKAIEAAPMTGDEVVLATYNPANKRDPFQPWGESGQIDVGGKCDPMREKETLEAHELLSLKLQGVIFTEREPLALVTTPDGKGYTLYRGKYLGKNCGRIVDIDDDRLLIEEKRKDPTDPFSDWQTVESELKLRPEEGT